MILDINIAKIGKCVNSIVEKAKKEIPKMPLETWNIEHYYAAEKYYIDDKLFILSLHFTPPLKEDRVKNVLVCCEVCIPALGMSSEVPIIDASAQDVLQVIDTDNMMEKITTSFNDILKDVLFNYDL